MEFEDQTEHGRAKNDICRLEWIAAAMEAARQHRETLPSRKNPLPAPVRLMADGERSGDRT